MSRPLPSALRVETTTDEAARRVHYGAAQTHPWAKPSSDPFNGFALRAALAAELRTYQETHADNRTAPKVKWDDITNSVERAQNLSPIHADMERSMFCLMPAGDSPSRRAFYEAIQLGCIPVIFREKSYGRLFPSTEMVNDVSRYTVFVDEAAYLSGTGPTLMEQLSDISLGEIRAKQEYLLKVAPKLQWALPELDESIRSRTRAGRCRSLACPSGTARSRSRESRTTSRSRTRSRFC